MRGFVLRAIVCTACMLPALVFGQAEVTGRISGQVVDESGAPVSGALVTIASPALQGEREITSGADGRFLAALLPAGTYTITTISPGTSPVEVTLRVGVGQTVPLEVRLTPGAEVTEEVTVHGDVSELETTQLGESFDYEAQIEDIPIQDRTLEAVATLSPNVTPGPSTDTLSIAGAPSFDTVVLLDGAEISDPYFGSGTEVYLEDAIQELQVLTSGINARYGRFQGGVLNAITKTGGNTFDGSLRSEFTNEDWNARTPFGEDQVDDVNQVYQGTLGGYVIKDRLWFFAGARTIPTARTAETALTTLEAFTRTFEEDRWQLKLRGALTPNHVLEASHLDFDAESSGTDFLLNCGDRGCLANAVRKDPRETNTLAYQGVLSPNLFLDAMLTQKNAQIVGGGAPGVGSPLWDFTNDRLYNNAWFDATDPDIRDNETGSLTMTQAVNLGTWGSHTLEYGVQLVRSTTGGENSQSPTGFNLISVNDALAVPGPECGDVEGCADLRFDLESGLAFRFARLPFPGGKAEASLRDTALFVHDSWELAKWRVDVGFRYENLTGDGPMVQQTADFREFAPRLGITYNIDANWQIQATYGKYVSRFNDAFANESVGVASAPRSFDLFVGPSIIGGTAAQIEAALQDPAQWVPLQLFSPEFGTTILDPDIESPYANNFDLGVRRALPRQAGVLTVMYTNRRFKNLIDDVVGGVGIVEVPDPLDPDNPLLFDRQLWTNLPQARREYEAVTSTWDYRPSTLWSLGGNYTYARLRGNYEGEAGNQPAIGSALGDYAEVVPQEAAAPFGALSGDMRHRANVWGSYRFDLGRAGALTLGSRGYYRSGLPFALAAGVFIEEQGDDPDYVGEVGNQYTHFFGGREAGRFSGFWGIDLALRYQVPLIRDVSGWIKLDVHNVLDNDELIAFDTSGVALVEGGVPTSDPALDQNDDGIIDGTGTLRFDPGDNFGEARSEFDYQAPRTYLVTVGLQW